MSLTPLQIILLRCLLFNRSHNSCSCYYCAHECYLSLHIRLLSSWLCSLSSLAQHIFINGYLIRLCLQQALLCEARTLICSAVSISSRLVIFRDTDFYRLLRSFMPAAGTMLRIFYSARLNTSVVPYLFLVSFLWGFVRGHRPIESYPQVIRSRVFDLKVSRVI